MLIIVGWTLAHSGAGAVAEGEPTSVAIFEEIALIHKKSPTKLGRAEKQKTALRKARFFS